MARRHHYKRRDRNESHEIDVTTFLNLMVVLVPFLLITAVFSRLRLVIFSNFQIMSMQMKTTKISLALSM